MAQVRDLAQTLRASEHWVALKPVFPVASGGLHPLHIPTLVDNLGIDIVIQAGGGVHGHPQGTRAGAKAMRQAAEAAVQKISLAEYARTHPELARVLEVWG
jgi:ribulose-bisphosphate carboxylase large chain